MFATIVAMLGAAILLRRIEFQKTIREFVCSKAESRKSVMKADFSSVTPGLALL